MVPLWLCLAAVPWQSATGAQPLAGAATGAESGAAGDLSNGSRVTDDLERLDNLNLLSDGLVEKAGSGSAPAHEFRLEARMYRELLRQVMLDNRERAESAQMPQSLLVDMVRMSALLHSAAECKTGLVIVCPADLMLQLRSQQARVAQGLEMLRMMQP